MGKSNSSVHSQANYTNLLPHNGPTVMVQYSLHREAGLTPRAHANCVLHVCARTDSSQNFLLTSELPFLRERQLPRMSQYPPLSPRCFTQPALSCPITPGCGQEQA